MLGSFSLDLVYGGGGSMNSQKHLVHLRDGISMATSPLLRNNGKAYTVAKTIGKCQDIDLSPL